MRIIILNFTSDHYKLKIHKQRIRQSRCSMARVSNKILLHLRK